MGNKSELNRVEELNGSKDVEAFLNYVADAERAHVYYSECYDNENKHKNNLWHKLELDNLHRNEAGRLITQMKHCSHRRRICDDIKKKLLLL